MTEATEVVKRDYFLSIIKDKGVAALYILHLALYIPMFIPRFYEGREYLISLVVLIDGLSLFCAYWIMGLLEGLKKEHAQFQINVFWFKVKLLVLYTVFMLSVGIFILQNENYIPLFDFLDKLVYGMIVVIVFYIYAASFVRLSRGQKPLS